MMAERKRLQRMLDAVAGPPSRVLTKTFFDLSVVGTFNVPATGPVVLASNHFSHLDPPLLDIHTTRNVRFLAVDQLFGKSKVLDGFLSMADAIPLDRDGYPVRAMRSAVEHLHDGHALGLFPEGRRVERWGVGDPKRGAAWLAWMSGAALVPVAIHGTQHSLTPVDASFHRTAVRIWYEKPLYWDAYADRVDPLGSMTADWFDAVDLRLSDWMDT